MNILKSLMTAGLILTCAGTAFGEPTIREVPLTWQDVARLDGEELYNNLCSTCHGLEGKGNGPAASALGRAVPDLTLLSAVNGGSFPHKQVEKVIYGKTRAGESGATDMPAWGQQFKSIRTGWSGFPQESYVRGRVHTLATYIESIQAD